MTSAGSISDEFSSVPVNTTSASTFVNPFGIVHVRVLFIIFYVAVFGVCTLGKLFCVLAYETWFVIFLAALENSFLPMG